MTWLSSCSVRTRVRCVSGTDGDQPRGGVRVCVCVCVWRGYGGGEMYHERMVRE